MTYVFILFVTVFRPKHAPETASVTMHRLKKARGSSIVYEYSRLLCRIKASCIYTTKVTSSNNFPRLRVYTTVSILHRKLENSNYVTAAGMKLKEASCDDVKVGGARHCYISMS